MAYHYQQAALLPKPAFFKMIPSKPKPSLFYTITKSPRCVVPSTKFQCKREPSSTNIVSYQNIKASRRSTNYFEPSVWHYDYIQSLNSDFVDESYAQERDRLKDEVREMFGKMENRMDQLELIDVLQRLGVASHFRLEIRNILDKVYNNKDRIIKRNNINDLYVTSLEFRLLRQHGYDVSSDVLNGFKDNKGDFDTHHSTNIEGFLSLYEASFHSMEDEIILEEAREFSSRYLKEFVNKNNNSNISELINHALELPLQWRILRLEAHWFIHFYERRKNMNPTLLQLAKLDFNIVQAFHQEDLKHSSRWWKRIGLGENLSFARDRLVESFFWTVGLAFEPQFGDFRKVNTKVNALITIIDDIYDVYGTLEELELFTYVVNRWDVNEMDILPDYMKICFLALYNFVNEVAFDSLKENRRHIISELKKVWADLCKAYLVEAKWYHSGYKPSLQEYMENACVTIAAPLTLFHAYFSLPNSTIMEDFVSFQDYYNIIRLTGTILRLADDLGTFKREKETGDVSNSIECYMNETGASEADARKHIKYLICSTWKKMNKEVSNSCYSKAFTEIVMNLARMSLCMYQHGDGHSSQDPETKNRIMSLFFKPIDM